MQLIMKPSTVMWRCSTFWVSGRIPKVRPCKRDHASEVCLHFGIKKNKLIEGFFLVLSSSVKLNEKLNSQTCEMSRHLLLGVPYKRFMKIVD